MWGDSHSLDFITLHKTRERKRDSSTGFEETTCHIVRRTLRAPRGREMWPLGTGSGHDDSQQESKDVSLRTVRNCILMATRELGNSKGIKLQAQKGMKP